MRPIIQMIFTVTEVIERDAGGLWVRGFLTDSRSAQGNPHYVDVSVLISENNQYMVDAAMQLMERQRVFVSGPVVNGSYVTQTGRVRDQYTILYPLAFIPLNIPAEDTESEATEEDPAVSAADAPQPKPQPQSQHQPQPRPQPQPVATPKVVEMEGTARPVTTQRNTSASTVGTALRPRTVTVPRTQTTQKVQPNTPVSEPDPVEEDDPNYDPFAEPI